MVHIVKVNVNWSFSRGYFGDLLLYCSVLLRFLFFFAGHNLPVLLAWRSHLTPLFISDPLTHYPEGCTLENLNVDKGQVSWKGTNPAWVKNRTKGHNG